MLIKHIMLWILSIGLLLSTAACNRYSRDSDLRAARNFIDAYYVLADQQKSLPLTSGAAREKVEKEIKLLANLQSRESAYRMRDITFELKSEEELSGVKHYFYELTIFPVHADAIKKLVMLSLDLKTKLISDFTESAAP